MARFMMVSRQVVHTLTFLALTVGPSSRFRECTDLCQVPFGTSSLIMWAMSSLLRQCDADSEPSRRNDNDALDSCISAPYSEFRQQEGRNARQAPTRCPVCRKDQVRHMRENRVTIARIGVIGAGIIGLSVARRLQQATNAEVTVMDKESTVAAHQTGHNSNVVHSGVYYRPGSLKATLCRRGGALLRTYCAERGLPYEEVGKVIVALRDDEIPRLLDLADRAKANGIPGIAADRRRRASRPRTTCSGSFGIVDTGNGSRRLPRHCRTTRRRYP